MAKAPRPKASEVKAPGPTGQDGSASLPFRCFWLSKVPSCWRLRALGEMEKNTNSKIDDLAGKIDTSTAKVQKVEDDLQGALARIAALEQGAPPKHYRVRWVGGWVGGRDEETGYSRSRTAMH